MKLSSLALTAMSRACASTTTVCLIPRPSLWEREYGVQQEVSREIFAFYSLGGRFKARATCSKPGAYVPLTAKATTGGLDRRHRTGQPTSGCPAEQQYVFVVLSRTYFLRRNATSTRPPRPSSDSVAGSGTHQVSKTTWSTMIEPEMMIVSNAGFGSTMIL
jgi:hypothetical protein